MVFRDESAHRCGSGQQADAHRGGHSGQRGGHHEDGGLLHGAETQVHADAGYTGVEKRAEIVALERRIDWQIARKRGQIKALAKGLEKEALKAVEKAKASVRRSWSIPSTS